MSALTVASGTAPPCIWRSSPPHGPSACQCTPLRQRLLRLCFELAALVQAFERPPADKLPTVYAVPDLRLALLAMLGETASLTAA
jgi:hypothetical protein